MLGFSFAFLMAAADLPATAATPPASPSSTISADKLTLQQRFDGASEAASAGRCSEAVPAFTALESVEKVQKNPHVFGTVLIRKGVCLSGGSDVDQAQRTLMAGLEKLNGAGANYDADIAEAYIALGLLAYRSHDYPAAKRQLLLAQQKHVAASQGRILTWLAHATLFDEGTESLGYADQALALAKAKPKPDKEEIAGLKTIHARVLLNHGQIKPAYEELKAALAAHGGLTLRVGLADIVTRSDLGIAALLNKDQESARKYLAYTGAGRSEKTPFATAASMTPPQCGGDADLRPDDTAVVEFGINDDGSISYSNPIYVSRSGSAVAAEFARAVDGWFWKPADTKAIPALFRLATRVELRCTAAMDRPSVRSILYQDVKAWYGTQKLASGEYANGRPDIETLKSELARREAVGERAALLPLLFQLMAHPAADPGEVGIWQQKASDVAAAVHAPATVMVYIGLFNMPETKSSAAYYRVRRDRYSQLLAKPEIMADPHVVTILRLLLVEANTSAAGAVLEQVVEDDRLGGHDPLRINALIQLASFKVRSGDIAGARESFEATGLTAQQCALVAPQPQITKSGASASDFPLEAVRWGFEGWVKTEFDVGADGKTLNQRAIIAYPPFVFRDAAIGISKDARYQQTYRPEGALGCGAQQSSVRFIMRHDAASRSSSK